MNYKENLAERIKNSGFIADYLTDETQNKRALEIIERPTDNLILSETKEKINNNYEKAEQKRDRRQKMSKGKEIKRIKNHV